MKRGLQILLAAALAAVSAWLAAEAADGAAGTNASTSGGASLGGTGIDSPDPRKEREADTRLKIQKKPPVEADKPASTGPARDRSRDLSDEADRQDEEFRKRSRK
jgi:hypothetical protein